jgi:hypothetical protein
VGTFAVKVAGCRCSSATTPSAQHASTEEFGLAIHGGDF